MTLKPLKECIKSAPDSVKRDYESASTARLIELILDCDVKLFTEKEDCPRVDALRAVIWFANAALTRRGISPRSRTCLGPVPITVKRLLHQIRKQDAPYLDLQWLGHRSPKCFPKTWSGAQHLASTAPSKLDATPDENNIVIDSSHEENPIDLAFDAADRLINRRDSPADKCRKLKLSNAMQAEHRWLCSRAVSKLLREIEEKEGILRKQMRSQGIAQLTDELIENRLLIIRAWKLAGGGTHWQATADTFHAITGRTITRQGVRDIITRLGEKKIIRRRRGRNKTLEPILSEE